MDLDVTIVSNDQVWSKQGQTLERNIWRIRKETLDKEMYKETNIKEKDDNKMI